MEKLAASDQGEQTRMT